MNAIDKARLSNIIAMLAFIAMSVSTWGDGNIVASLFGIALAVALGVSSYYLNRAAVKS